MPPTLRVLVVDDSEDDALLIVRQIRKGGHQVDFARVDTAEAMARALQDHAWDIIVSDVNMPRFSAAHALDLYRDSGGDGPFIVVSGVIGEETAVSLLKGGAHDFVLKTNMARLVPAIEREMRDWQSRRARRQAEEALRVSEERYALAARGSNDGLWDWDLYGGEIYLSPRWQEMAGFPEGGLGTTPDEWFSRIHPEDMEEVRRALDLHLDGMAPHFAVEHRMRHRDGSWRWMLARGMAVRSATGKPCRMAGSLTDITERKLSEQRLRKTTEDLENALAAKTRFLAAASHDLRQPVQALLFFTTVLESQLRHHPSFEIVKDLQQSLDGMRALLDSLLSVSKLDAGIIVPALGTVSVGAVLEQIATEMRPLAGQKGLSLRVVAPDLAVATDPVLLGRIVRNLVENAIRYCDAGGILIGARRRGGQVAVEVWDTGIGIPDHLRRQIFEEFFQVGNPERDRRKGLGLGLAIVQRLCRLLDHGIEVRSVLGRGSLFRVTLPAVAASPVHPAVAEPELLSAGSAGTILVIDDEASVARATAAVVSSWGFDAIASESADQALGALLGLPCAPYAIIADYRLRDGHTGLEAIERICRQCGRQIPCIVVTGDTGPDRLREVEASGAMILHKPVSPAELHRALARVTERHAAAE